MVLIPININSHWVLVTVQLNKKKFTYYDSLNDYSVAKTITQVLVDLFDLIFNAYFFFNDSTVNLDGITEVFACPTQGNNNDCGVFVCKFIEYISSKKSFDFYQEDMDYFRVLIGIQLIKGELLTM